MPVPWLVAAACSLLATVPTPARGSDRVALVIGNGDYHHASKLGNPVNDASAVGEKLTAAGYEVILLREIGIRDLLRGLQAFCDAAEGAEAAVFFYAGHGVEVKGENFLLPVDAELKEEVDLNLEALSLNKVMKDLGDSKATLKVMVLDCCRDNPLANTRSWMQRMRGSGGGLAAVAQNQLAEGTMLVFSAAPGKPASDGQGEHSPFTAALLEQMAGSGKSIAAVFSQVAVAVSDQEPWIRFDGSGKSFAAFNTYPLLPGISKDLSTSTFTVSSPNASDTSDAAPPADSSPSTGLKGAGTAARDWKDLVADLPPRGYFNLAEVLGGGPYEDYNQYSQLEILKRVQVVLKKAGLYLEQNRRGNGAGNPEGTG